jgi:DNA-binding IclR family transcriptional regulator
MISHFAQQPLHKMKVGPTAIAKALGIGRASVYRVLEAGAA